MTAKEEYRPFGRPVNAPPAGTPDHVGQGVTVRTVLL